MDCSIVYYVSYKTGYIQRGLAKKFRTMTDITLRSGYAAVSVPDLHQKFSRALAESQLVVVIGGLSAAGDDNVMTALSEHFTSAALVPDFSKRIVNESGSDGYLIKTGDKYVLVLPDDPEAVQRMFGTELLKNISPSENADDIKEPVRTHTVVFAPEIENPIDRIPSGSRLSIAAIVGITITLLVCAAAAAWIYLLYRQGGF